MTEYTTELMTGFQADEFVSWFDAVIGTETEIDKHDDGKFSVTCFEITGSERRKCITQDLWVREKIEAPQTNQPIVDCAKAQRNELPEA